MTDAGGGAPHPEAVPGGGGETHEIFAGNRARLAEIASTHSRFLFIKPCASCERRAEWLKSWRSSWRRR